MINIWLVVSVFAIALGVSYLLTPLIEGIAYVTGALSSPGRRRIHARSTPYLGGIAIYVAFIAGVLFVFRINPQFAAESSRQLKGILIAGTLIVVFGLWDDLKKIRPVIKLIGQVVVALILFVYDLRIELLTNPFIGGEIHLPLFISILLTVIWFVALMNAMNLIDGMDGLAAGITAIVCVSLIFIALHLHNYVTVFLLAALAGSCLGFLRFNYYPAKIFMGDAGSLFLGLILASVALLGSQHKASTAVVLMTPITVLAIPVYDTLVAIVRRLFGRKSIFKADKKHLHHRLLSTGLNQNQIALFLYLVTLYLGVFAFLFVLIPDKYALILLFLIALGLFMGSRIIGFIERAARQIHRLELKKRKEEL